MFLIICIKLQGVKKKKKNIPVLMFFTYLPFSAPILTNLAKCTSKNFDIYC